MNSGATIIGDRVADARRGTSQRRDPLRLDRLLAEHWLLLACCRPLDAPGRIEAIRAAASQPFDARRLMSLTIAHRVDGFVEQGLKAAGIALSPEQQTQLERRAARGRMAMLRHSAETIRLSRLFEQSGIDAIFLKGAALAMVAHGSLSQKTSSDIDILVDPDSLDRLIGALPDWGYRFSCVLDLQSDRQVRRYAALNSETTWHNRSQRLTLDVHQRLMFHKGRMPRVGLASPRESVALSPIQSVTTIARDHLFAYLTVHGLGHGWERIKWLADLAALLGDDPAEIERLHGVARALGAGRCADVGLILAAEMFGTPVPKPLLQRLLADRINRYLGSVSIGMISRTEYLHRGYRHPFADAVGHLLIPYLGAPSWRDWLGNLWSEIGRPRSVTQLKVPTPLLPLFSIVWVPLFLAGRSLSALVKARGQGSNKLASP